MRSTRYRIVATKRNTDDVVDGWTDWDGLSSIFDVVTLDGTHRTVSTLDTITTMYPEQEQTA